MRFNVLTSVLSLAAVVAGAALPPTIGGLAIRRRVEEVPVDLWRRGYKHVTLRWTDFEIEESPTLNPLVFNAKSPSYPRLLALKYPDKGHYNLAALIHSGLNVRGYGIADDTNWVVIDPPPSDFQFFTVTPEYQELLRQQRETGRALPLHHNPVVQNRVNQLIEEAAKYAVAEVVNHDCSAYIHPTMTMNDFMFNFKEKKAQVIRLSFPPMAGAKRKSADLSWYKSRFQEDVMERIQEDTSRTLMHT